MAGMLHVRHVTCPTCYMSSIYIRALYFVLFFIACSITGSNTACLYIRAVLWKMERSSPSVDPCNEAGINVTIVVKLYYSIVVSTFNPYLRPNSGIFNTCIPRSVFERYDHSEISEEHSFSDFISPDCALFETAPSALVLDRCTTYITDAKKHDGQCHQLWHVQLQEHQQKVSNFSDLNLELGCQLVWLLY